MRVRSLESLPAEMRSRARQQLGSRGTPRSKYGAKRTSRGLLKFDSALEARCWDWLGWRKDAGQVKYVLRQVPFELPGGVRYRLDFLVALADGGVELIDAKGMLTPVSRIKIKQVESLYGVRVILWHD